ncbi:MAG: cytochrome c [Pirellulales bacterium]
MKNLFGAIGAIIVVLFCDLDLQAHEDDSKMTFANRIAPIIFKNCSSCHHTGQAGPFELISYQDVSRHAETIRVAVTDNYMPPWKPVSTGIEFANHRQLSDEDKKILIEWIDSGCPEGSPNDLPSPPKFHDGWRLGKPDLVVKMEKPFTVPASGKDLYRSFVLPVNLPEDRWIKAIELRPSARNVVHHALFFIADSSSLLGRQERDGQPGFRGMNFMRGTEFLSNGPDRLTRGLGGYVPGAVPNMLPGDLARLLPKGSDIIMQTHFHPSGKVEVEQAELAIYFSDTKPSHMLVPLQMPPLFGVGAGIDVPAGETNYQIRDAITLPVDVQAIEIGGHAHYICKNLKLDATLPDGKQLTLLQIDDWDLDWQDQYLFKQPIDLPKGTKLTSVISYDNSKNNPENPFSPPQRIAWGRESTDEMGSVTLLLTAKEENDRGQLEQLVSVRNRQAIQARVKQQTSGLSALGGGRLEQVGLIRLLDRNSDSKLQANEIPERFRERLLEFLDSNGDDVLDESEIRAGRTAMQRLMEDR